MYCTSRAATGTVPGPSSVQNQAPDPTHSTSLSKDVPLLLASSPSLVKNQNKTKDTLQGWVDGWMIWDLGFFLCGFAFK